jgi:hypothetical protein
MRSLLIAGAVLVMSGCASVPMGDPARSAELKKFTPKTDVAQIYVCRNSRTFGMGIRPDIELDGKQVAKIPRSTYIYQEVKPGAHTLVAKTLEHDSKLPFTIAAGEQKFFQTWISVGVFAGWGLIDEIDQAAGKECVTDGELVESAGL